MVRAKGSRNTGYDERRAELLECLRHRIRQPGASNPTLRELSIACGCSVSTLKHYFGRRQDIVLAIFEDTHARARRHLERVREPTGPLDQSIRDAVHEAWMVLSDLGAARTLGIGLSEGLGHAALGPGYLNDVFDPYIRALCDRLATHILRGEMRDVEPRMAALALASPLLLAALHQEHLDGARVWPLDREKMLDHTVESFLRAYAL
ncbi:TetR/AcrR family transcriptional regulator [Paracoccus suum]|uniref:TetR/AcrR family transcriptional regulator n=1 Tax=Paracoccus suum TaxID=2259340 RepID=A0A344PG97_9RHOB|nr:TetR/AcrR family transcriptional regulator [Paracoccus suum]AXC48402.1 TetR/AcrR family transcriptional regulator [Paracoccus suum]